VHRHPPSCDLSRRVLLHLVPPLGSRSPQATQLILFQRIQHPRRARLNHLGLRVLQPRSIRRRIFARSQLTSQEHPRGQRSRREQPCAQFPRSDQLRCIRRSHCSFRSASRPCYRQQPRLRQLHRPHWCCATRQHSLQACRYWQRQPDDQQAACFHGCRQQDGCERREPCWAFGAGCLPFVGRIGLAIRWCCTPGDALFL